MYSKSPSGNYENDYLITKEKLDEKDNLKDVANDKTKFETSALGDPNLRILQKGDRIQLERRGYFIVDEPYLLSSKPIVLISIPDGHTSKQQSVIESKIPHKEKPKETKKEEISKNVK